jgi:hypothetical protein
MKDFRQAVVWGTILFVCGATWLAACLSSCSLPPTPLTQADTVVIVETTASIARCQAEGRAANSYRSYAICMCRDGLHTPLQCAVDFPKGLDAGSYKDVSHGD